MLVIAALAQQLDEALPQTQCTRCGYADCRAYAEAIAQGAAAVNQCPPGGAQGVARLAALTGRRAEPLNPAHGSEGPRLLAVIDEAWCIGCTLCLQACPVDAIVGGPKAMHTVIEAACTGCELCLPACPVDCISLTAVTGQWTGWHAWSGQQAASARDRYTWHRQRMAREQVEQNQRFASAEMVESIDTVDVVDVVDVGKIVEAVDVVEAVDTVLAVDPAPRGKRAVIEAALARARAVRSG